MKRYNLIFLLSFNLLWCLTGCSQTIEEKQQEANNDYLLMATIYQQQAAEKRALSYQAFNTAKLMLDNSLKMARLTKRLAVVVDIDETVLDNSPFEAKSILENTDYPVYWKEWCEKESATPIAGALQFLKYAESNGVDVFYITNRKEELRQVTLNNLVSEGFPFADNDHLLLRTSTSDKEPRRKSVEETHYIVLLVGDNLGDFSNIFDNKDNLSRFELTDSLQHEFGTRFIVLPNPMYGTWISSLWQNPELTKEQKIEILKKNLKSF